MIVLLLAFLLTTACGGGIAEPTYMPRNGALRAPQLYFYPVANAGKARAFVFFFWQRCRLLETPPRDRGSDGTAWIRCSRFRPETVLRDAAERSRRSSENLR
jgi:hypothetical protein